MTTRPRPSMVVALATALALLFAACGGGDDGRPSADAIEDALLEADDATTEEQATCIADILHGSDLSDEGLQTLLDSTDVGDIDDIDLSDDDREAIEAAFGEALTTCVTTEGGTDTSTSEG